MKFNLSERLMYLDEEKGFTKEDVKEFIRLLKEEFGDCYDISAFQLNEAIEKLAGEKLI